MEKTILTKQMGGIYSTETMEENKGFKGTDLTNSTREKCVKGGEQEEEEEEEEERNTGKEIVKRMTSYV